MNYKYAKQDAAFMVNKELENANKNNPLFASDHEAWAVMLEEVEEVREVLEKIEKTMDTLWADIKANYSSGQDYDLDSLNTYALELMLEAVQVGAMARKATLSRAARGVGREEKEDAARKD